MKAFDVGRDLGPLVLYTRKFAALTGAGVSLRRCLEMLQATTDDPALAAANGELREEVEREEATLSGAMAEHPEVFSPLYVAFVRAGEVGGVLDETLSDLADWLEWERAARNLLGTQRLMATVAAKVLGGEAKAPNVQAALERAEAAARVASFCRLLERCLTAGVPRGLALATAAEVLGEPTWGQLREKAAALRTDERMAPVLAEVAELRAVVATMVAAGEEYGAAELMLRKAAEFMDAEASHALIGAASAEGFA
jgi:type II secretory pathway component PulF